MSNGKYIVTVKRTSIWRIEVTASSGTSAEMEAIYRARTEDHELMNEIYYASDADFIELETN